VTGGAVTRTAPKFEDEVYLIWREAVMGRPVRAGLGVKMLAMSDYGRVRGD